MADLLGKLGDLEAHRDQLNKQRDKAQQELDSVLATLPSAKDLAALERAKETATNELHGLQVDVANERATLAAIDREQSTTQENIKALKAEAAKVERQLATMRADLAAMKAKFA